MAVNKNFVVKNGLEVRQDLILADATNTTVGIGTSVPQYTLDVAGGIGVTNIYVAGFSTFIGVSTHTGQSFFNDVQVSGAGTVTGDLTVGGDLNVTGDISYDEVTGRNITISGLSTFEGLSYFGANVGVGTTNPAIAADSNNTNILNAGIVTANYIYGDISGATGVTTSITAAIGVSSEGTFVGSAATIINFASSNGTAWDIQNSGAGIATATITPGVSIGLAIALGG